MEEEEEDKCRQVVDWTVSRTEYGAAFIACDKVVLMRWKLSDGEFLVDINYQVVVTD